MAQAHAGSRFEHWQAVGEDEVLSELLGNVLARLAVDDLPGEISIALLSAKLNGIRKSSGGVRVLGCGGVIRRIVFKQVANELHYTLKTWCTDKQFGLQKRWVRTHVQVHPNPLPQQEGRCGPER